MLVGLAAACDSTAGPLGATPLAGSVSPGPGLAGCVSPAPGWTRMTGALPAGVVVVTFLDRCTGVLAVGASAPPSSSPPGTAGASLWRTTDGGRTWALAERLDGVDVLAIAPVGSSGVVAVGGRTTGSGTTPIAFLSGDGGRTWRPVAVPGRGILRAVAFGDGSRGVAAGNFFAAVTADGGRTWTEVPLADLPDLAAAAADPGHISLAGQDIHGQPVVLTSTDGGRTWASSVVLAGQGRVQALARDGAVLWAGGFVEPNDRAPFLRVSADGGATWAAASTPEPVQVVSVGTVDGQHGVMSAFAGPGRAALLQTSDGGSHWRVALTGSLAGGYAFPGPVSVTAAGDWAVGGTDLYARAP